FLCRCLCSCCSFRFPACSLFRLCLCSGFSLCLGRCFGFCLRLCLCRCLCCRSRSCLVIRFDRQLRFLVAHVLAAAYALVFYKRHAVLQADLAFLDISERKIVQHIICAVRHRNLDMVSVRQKLLAFLRRSLRRNRRAVKIQHSL